MSQLTICIIICVLTAISYILEKIPMGTTALLSMLAFVLTGCLAGHGGIVFRKYQWNYDVSHAGGGCRL